jgi:D-3-phosphoglycerate dehydrogenase
VILTPHIGGSTQEAQEDIGRFVAGKLRDFVAGGSTTMSVNLPQVQPGEAVPGRCRILHVHRNVPGVLATVNGVLADSEVNIEGQTLSTRGELGYVVTDIAGPLPAELIAKLESLDETVRLRIIG